MEIVYSSDIHGNMVQYDKLFSYCINERIDLLIIGGDLTPKDVPNRTVFAQKEFLKKLINKIKLLSFKVLLIMGNDDFKINKNIITKQENLILLGLKPYEFNEFNFVGYTYVPITPFKYKDWEKPDLENEYESSYRNDFIIDGFISNKEGLEPYSVNLDDRSNSIEKDLDINYEKLIAVIHAPPFNTSLDIIHSGDHVGSKAVLKFIKEKKPLITFHGHIHETVDKSGSFIEKINETFSITSGNDYMGDGLYLIRLNIAKPEYAKRIKL